MIGPYKVPNGPSFSEDAQQSNPFAHYMFYKLMLDDADILAVFNVNNYCFGILRKNIFFMRFYEESEKQLPAYIIDPPLNLPNYQHIGYVKTYPKCKTVYHYPWYLIQNADTGEVPGYGNININNPLVNPPLALYKALLNTDCTGVYFDMTKGVPVFIK